MICPHCDQNLLRRERNDRTCGHCRKRFALEPKESVLGLHDARAHRLVSQLGDGGRVRYTPTQLWYAVGRGRLPEPGSDYTAWGCGSLAVLLYVMFIVMFAVLELPFGAVAQAAGVVLLAYVPIHLLIRARARRAGRRGPIRMPAKLDKLSSELEEHWPAAYGGMPDGLVTQEPPTEMWGGQGAPVAAVVCPDIEVLTCLAANDLPRRLGVRLYTEPSQVPRGTPAVVLHDASPQGVLFAAEARRVLGTGVTVAGLAPRAVMPVPGALEDSGPARKLRLRETPLLAEEVARLRTAEPRLSEAELEWLAAGWWFPLTAVRPAALLAAAEKALRRAREDADPAERAARAVGFLTLPTEGADDGEHRAGRYEGDDRG